jgi:hypothetical protein
MAAFSDYFEQKIVQWISGTQLPTPTASTFLQLYSQDPTEAGSPTGALFSTRYSIASGSTSWTTASGGAGSASGATLSNASAFTITASATATASATHFALFNASASGDLLFYGQLTTAKTIGLGDEVKFNIGSLILEVR